MYFGNLNIQKPFHFTVEEKVLLNHEIMTKFFFVVKL